MRHRILTLYRKVYVAPVTLGGKVTPMTTTETALENLRIIRSLMERAHIYRSVSAPAALVGGVMAILAAGWPVFHALQNNGDAAMSDFAFLAVWLVILAIASAVNLFLLAREASDRQQPFISEGMRMAVRAIAPPMIVGGAVGLGLIVYLGSLTLATLIWALCYGLALLAAKNFSPRSLSRLGWAFVITGLLLFFAWASNKDIRLLQSDVGPASLVMGLTFGLLHLLYAIAVFWGRTPGEVESK